MVIMDDNSYSATNAEIRDYFNHASTLLYERTCTSINILNIQHVSINDQSQIDTITDRIMMGNQDIVRQSNGLTFFTAFSECRSYGGCAWTLIPGTRAGITNFCNTFSNSDNATNFLYGNIIDWNHRFGECGYDRSSSSHISDTSIDGECRNTPGTQCILRNGYYMCENLLLDFYASDARLFSIATTIHELMHHFDRVGAGGHYGTESCVPPYPPRNFPCASTIESQCYFESCPFSYENFKNSRNLCTSSTLSPLSPDIPASERRY